MSDDNKAVENGLPVADFGTILGLSRETTKWLDVPEWNAKVKLKALSKAEQIKLRRAATTRGQLDEVKLEMNLLVYSLVEPRLTFDQVDELYAKADSKALSRISAAALTLSGLTEDYIEQAEMDMKS